MVGGIVVRVAPTRLVMSLDLETLRDDPDLRERQRVRFERMAPHVESTDTDGIYEVIDEVTP